VPAYIIETGRSYRNPIEGKDFTKDWTGYEGVPDGYQIEFHGEGPGSLPLGKDNVHYIGDEEELEVANAGKSRSPIYRWYRSGRTTNNPDHTYITDPALRKEDVPGEKGKGTVIKKYNPEPRRNTPVFHMLNRNVSGATEFFRHYSSSNNNTKITSNSNEGGGYTKSATLGYMCTNSGDAANYAVENDSTPLYHYRSSSFDDDLYTINPAGEVNLSGGPIPPKDAQDGDYVYQGILGYVYTIGYGGGRKQVIDVGRIGPTGQCVDKSGWYQWSTDWTMSRYNRQRDSSDARTEGTPGIVGWGHPGNIDIIDEEANFEWFYGLNGAVKGAVPRYLGFEDMYDSQFVYYLYDTSYPWNGPIFGIQYRLSDAGCCPNATDSNGDQTCLPNYTFGSHFYQVRQDSWETRKSTIELHDGNSQGVNESFWECGTDSRRIFFRYTSTSGSFKRGEELNGWVLSEVRYFGDEQKCGFMELTEKDAETGAGNKFTYNQSISAGDGATGIVLAGYGIRDKCAFWGVYEFPKKIVYERVDVNPEALVAQRTLDEAKMEAVINSEGELKTVNIINGGTGYNIENVIISVTSPGVLEEFSGGDMASEMTNSLSLQENQFENLKGQGYKMQKLRNRDIQMHSVLDKGRNTMSKESNKTKKSVVYNRGKAEIQKQAVVVVTGIDKQGAIISVQITDPGSGYNNDHPPYIAVVIPEKVTRGLEGQDTKTINPMTVGNDNALKNVQQAMGDDSDGSSFDIGALMDEGFAQLDAGLSTEIPEGYIKITDINDKTKSELCQDLSSACLDHDFIGCVSQAMPQEANFVKLRSVSDEIGEFLNNEYAELLAIGAKADAEIESRGGLYGFNLGERCIKIPQPNSYKVTRFFDIPCTYTTTSEPLTIIPGIDEPRTISYGWLIHKYCASEKENATFRVSMTLEGRTKGSQGQDFMTFLREKMPSATLTPTRKVGAGVKTWNCSRGTVKGRCYEDPNNNGVVFVPIGLDENTFDYNQSGYDEFTQLQLWLHDNLTYQPNLLLSWLLASTVVPPSGTVGQPDYNAGSPGTNATFNYTGIAAAPWSGGEPPDECWDTYVRGVGASDGPLDVFCGYDVNGDGISGDTYNNVAALMNICAAVHDCSDVAIAIQPTRVASNNVLTMGPYEGEVRVRNYLTGVTQTYAKAVQYLSNPYFSECDVEYGGSQDIGDVIGADKGF
jgi:hypothetical protein